MSFETYSVPEKERNPASFLEVLPDDIPYDPQVQPIEFTQFMVDTLTAIGRCLPTENQQRALYSDIDVMLFVGFDGAEVAQSGSFGDRRTTWGIKGMEFKQAARQAVLFDSWPEHSTVNYAVSPHDGSNASMPAIVALDSTMMRYLTPDTFEEFTLRDPDTDFDDAVIAVFYLPDHRTGS